MDKDLLTKYVQEINVKIKDLPRFDSDYDVILKKFDEKHNDILQIAKIDKLRSWLLEIDNFLVDLKFIAGSALYCAEAGLSDWDENGKLTMDLPNILFWLFARDYFMRLNSYFDKIGGFINLYYQLGLEEGKVNFRKVLSILPANIKDNFKDLEQVFDNDSVLIKMREFRNLCIHSLSPTNYRRLEDINSVDDKLLRKGMLFSIKKTCPNESKEIEIIYGPIWHNADDIKDFVSSSINKIAEFHSKLLSTLKASPLS